jgi:hypothetical protein
MIVLLSVFYLQLCLLATYHSVSNLIYFLHRSVLYSLHHSARYVSDRSFCVCLEVVSFCRLVVVPQVYQSIYDGFN